jgi:hypothetical protein
MAHQPLAAAHPLPVHAPVQHVGQFADLAFFRRVGRIVAGAGQHARDQQGGVDAGQLAVKCARTAVHIQEMVIKTLVAGGRGRVALLAVGEEAQCRQRAPDRVRARHAAPFHTDRIHRQCHADCGDTGGPIVGSLVADKAVGRIDLVDEVVERVLLHGVQ